MRHATLALSIVLAACGSDAPPPSTTARAPAAPASAPVVSSAPPQSTAEPPATETAPATSVVPITAAGPPVPSIADALAPAAAATVLTEVVRGHTHYVLYALDGAALARADVLARPGGDERLARVDDEIDRCSEDAQGGWPGLDCLVPVVPDMRLVGHAICDASHSIGIARVLERDGAFVLERQRLLFAFSCSSGSGPSEEVRASDLDGDGTDELTVLFSIAPPDTDDLANEDGRLGYVLDARDLHTQFRASREWSAVIGDVGGSTTSGELVWRVMPPDAEGHRSLHVRSHGTDATQDDETGDSDSHPFDTQADCPYEAAADAWVCPPDAVREYFFGDPRGRLGDAWVAETPDELLGPRAPLLGSALGRPRDDEEPDGEGDDER